MGFGSTSTPVRPSTRDELAAQVGEVGESVNRFRMALLDAKKPFTAGIVRAAEEALVVVQTMLTDAAVQETEL